MKGTDESRIQIFASRLVRNPKFAEAVRVIVLEARQPVLSAAVDEVNQRFSPSRRIQIFLN